MVQQAGHPRSVGVGQIGSHDLDRSQPPGWLGEEPFPQVGALAALDQIDHDPAIEIDHPGRVLGRPVRCGCLTRGLVDPELADRADPGRVIDQGPPELLHCCVDGLPRDSKAAGLLGHRPGISPNLHSHHHRPPGGSTTPETPSPHTPRSRSSRHNRRPGTATGA